MILNKFSFSLGSNDIVIIERIWFYSDGETIHHDTFAIDCTSLNTKYFGDCIEEI